MKQIGENVFSLGISNDDNLQSAELRHRKSAFNRGEIQTEDKYTDKKILTIKATK